MEQEPRQTAQTCHADEGAGGDEVKDGGEFGADFDERPAARRNRREVTEPGRGLKKDEKVKRVGPAEDVLEEARESDCSQYLRPAYLHTHLLLHFPLKNS